MNLYPIWGFYVSTTAISQNNLIFFQKIIGATSQQKTQFSYTQNLINTHSFITLPFFVKLKFIKTIRTTVPSLQYQYILPSERFVRSNYYDFRLKNIFNKNKLHFETTGQFYSTLLKI